MALTSIKDIESQETQQAKNNLDAHNANAVGDYTPSQNVTDALGTYTGLQNNKPADYVSKNQNVIDSLLDQIVNRKKFEYNMDADPIYQQYKNQYTTLGKQAMLDTTAQASALSGGYGNSYASTAGSQAYQGYLQQLNNIIPDLASNARDAYNTDTQNLYNQYSAVGAQEDRDYSQYQGNYSNWQGDVSNALSAYDTMHDNDFGEYQQKVSNWESTRDYLNSLYNGSVANDQYVNDYNYQLDRDAVADEQWAKEYALSLAAAQRSSSSSTNSGKNTSTTIGATTSSTISDKTYKYYSKIADGKGSSYLDDLYSSGKIDEKTWMSLMDEYDLKHPSKGLGIKNLVVGNSAGASLSGFMNWGK